MAETLRGYNATHYDFERQNPQRDLTQTITVVLQKKNLHAYEAWREDITRCTQGFKGVRAVARFPVHGNERHIDDDGELAFVVVIRFQGTDDVSRYAKDQER